MSSKPHNNGNVSRPEVRLGGRNWPVIDQIQIGRRLYLILDKVGHGNRRRYMVFEPHAGPGGELRSLLILSPSPAAWQYLRILKRLSAGNQNLPLILDYRRKSNQLIIVSSWVHGPDLKTYLNDVRRGVVSLPSATEAFRLVRGLAHGLAQLHRGRTIIHGDLKPANIILASKPSRLVMIDYGSAWVSSETQRRSNGDGRSRAYAAPELTSRPPSMADARSDQFSASVILYELLTLTLPYDTLGGMASHQPAAEQLKTKYIPPSQQSPDRGQLPAAIWRAIDRVVSQGLALQAEDRFATSSLWVEQLDQIYMGLKPAARLSPINRRMTRVIARLCQFLSPASFRRHRVE